MCRCKFGRALQLLWLGVICLMSCSTSCSTSPDLNFPDTLPRRGCEVSRPISGSKLYRPLTIVALHPTDPDKWLVVYDDRRHARLKVVPAPKYDIIPRPCPSESNSTFMRQ